MKLTATLIALAAAKKTKETRVPRKPPTNVKEPKDVDTVVENCGFTITSNDTVITSPGFDDPGYYYNNLDCVWTIDIPGATDITVIPEHFDIESHDYCGYDELLITGSSGQGHSFCGTHTDFGTPPDDDDDYSSYYYSGSSSSYSSSSSGSSGSYSGSSSSSGSSGSSGYSSSSSYSSSGRKRRSEEDPGSVDKSESAPRDRPMWNPHFTENGAQIEFTTDNSVTQSGFKLRIVTGIVAPDNTCAFVQEGSGVVSSPGYPGEYFNDDACSYTLVAEAGKNIEINFLHFDIEESSANCGFDALTIDGIRYCGTSYDYDLAPKEKMIIQSDRTTIYFDTDFSVTHSGFQFEWRSVDSLQNPAVFWAHMQDFYDSTVAQMEDGSYDRPWKVPYFKRMFNRVVNGDIENYSQLSGVCHWRGQHPTYEPVEVKFFDENSNRCMNLIRLAVMGLQYIDSYVCMDGHSRPNSSLKRWKGSMNKIRDMGREFCDFAIWEEGPVSLPAGLSCPAPENPFQRSADRIVGGQDVDRATTWPWIVDLNGCGGSIISKNPSGKSDWILTAAHCCEYSSQMDVTIGSQNTVTNTPGQFTLTSTRIINHPDYNGGLGVGWGTGHDICLLEVPNLSDSQPAECDNCWSPVCLPSEHVESGRFCYVAGWGTTSAGGLASDELKDVGINIFSQEQCIATAYESDEIKDSEFCAGVPDLDNNGITDGGKDSCQGDSGGPLVCQEGTTAVQYGVVSWGVGCAGRNNPGVYAKLAGPLTEWIYEQINAE